MTDNSSQSSQIAQWLERLAAGDETARQQLLGCAGNRLLHLTRKMLGNFPGVKRWEQTDDVYQNATLRLYEALKEVQPTDSRHFFRLAALEIRRELIDLARRYQGPEGMAAHHQTEPLGEDDSAPPVMLHEPAEGTRDPGRMAEWAEFHAAVDQLPDAERETFDLLWYHGLSQQEVAEVLAVTVRTVKRRWRQARLHLYAILEGDRPH